MRHTALLAAAIAVLGCASCTTGDDNAPELPPITASVNADATALHTTVEAAAARDAFASLIGIEPAFEDEIVTYGDQTFPAVAFSGRTLDGNPSTVILEMYSTSSGPNPVDLTNSNLGQSTGTWTIEVNGQPVEAIHYQGTNEEGFSRISVIAGTTGDIQFRILAFNSNQDEADRVAATLYSHFSAA